MYIHTYLEVSKLMIGLHFYFGPIDVIFDVIMGKQALLHKICSTLK